MVDRRRLVEDLFEAALKRAPPDREAFLDRACANAPELRRLVEQLLRADQEAGSFLNHSTVSLGQESTDFATAPSPGPSFVPKLSTTIGFKVGTDAAGRFKILRFVARGGMGEVYEAWDSELKERVAIKIVRPELAGGPEVLERFRSEVKQARAISHPNVCRVHELFCHESLDPPRKIWFLTMEFLEGASLSDYIRHQGPLGPDAAFGLISQIVHGLSAAHRLGVIHRDLKTGNVMLVSASTGGFRPVITDFGLALNVLRPDNEFDEPPGQGTPAYMAPEQRNSGKVTSAADQYALGIVMCEMLTGSRPLPGSITDQSTASFTSTHRLPPRWKRVTCGASRYSPKIASEAWTTLSLP